MRGLSQTSGDIHNQVISAIVNQFSSASNVTFQQLYNFAQQFAGQNNLSIPSYQTLSSYKSNYLSGKTSCDQVFTALKNGNLISNELNIYFTQLKSNIEANATDQTSSINSIVDDFTRTSYYTSLSQDNKQIAQVFNDVAKKSYSFWYGNEINSKKNCRLVCIICIALTDAAFTSICGPVCGAVMSAVARCCLCGSCGNVTCT